MSDGNQLPPAGETACPTYFAKPLIQQGGAGGFACRSHGHNQRSASKLNKFPKTVMHPKTASAAMFGQIGVACSGEERIHRSAFDRGTRGPGNAPRQAVFIEADADLKNRTYSILPYVRAVRSCQHYVL